jgi:hypothetical protein
MLYRVGLSIDHWGKNIIWDSESQALYSEYVEACQKVLASDPSIPGLFQQGAIIEVHDSKNSYIGVQVVGYDNYNVKDQKSKKKEYPIQPPFITEKSCTFNCRLVCTGVPG